MLKNIRLDRFEIGENQPPVIVAEMSGNHNHSLDKAIEIVDAAADAGCDALKIQTYTPEMLTIDCDAPDFVVKGMNSDWEKQTLFQLFQRACTPLEWHEPIFARARRRGIVPFSTPFAAEAVDLLESLDCPFYKIASFENSDLELVKKVAETGKPVIVSTGMATLVELEALVATIRKTGNEQFVLLKCTSSYPSTAEHAHLKTILHLRERFKCHIGLSDHTMGTAVALAATALGAVLIEKHFTISRADGGVDSSFSMEPAEMGELVHNAKITFEALGGVQFGPTEGEKTSAKYKRSIYVIADVKKGEQLTRENIRVIRPGLGLSPLHLSSVLGKKSACDLYRGMALSWEHLGQ